MSIHVLIAGAGLGGLCLAQGLRKRGVHATVFEREPRAETAQGYRIHINQTGSRALSACLPTELWDAFVATAGEPSAGLTFFSEQLEELLFIEQRRIERRPPGAPLDPTTSEHPVNRVALRRVLLGGLGDAVQFGKELVRYELGAETVSAFFADGSSARGDVLVAADGIGSRIRQQYLPSAQVVDTGIAAVGGKLRLDRAARSWLPEPFVTRLNNVIPPRACGMFIAPYRRKPVQRTREREHADLDAPLRLDDLGEHVFWAFVSQRKAHATDARGLEGARLQTLVLHAIESWHPDLVRLVAESDPHTVAAVRVQSAEPVERWRTTRVTLLGDAIHAMTPLQGLGGNTALSDAALLCRRLVAADRGQIELHAAIASYETTMLHDGFRAVRLSRKVGELAVSDDRFGRALFKTVLRVADRLPPIKQRMFGAPARAESDAT